MIVNWYAKPETSRATFDETLEEDVQRIKDNYAQDVCPGAELRKGDVGYPCVIATEDSIPICPIGHCCGIAKKIG